MKSNQLCRLFVVFLLCFGIVVVYKMQCSIIRMIPLAEDTARLESRSQFHKPVDWDKVSQYGTTQCQSSYHVVFLKIHKAGSSTVMNLIARFGINNDLVFALPRTRNYINRLAPINTSILLPPPPGREYNLMCNHAVYNRTVFRSFFSNKTRYLAILREPFHQFISAFRYYSVYRKVGGSKPVRKFLMYPNRYNFNKGLNFVHNRMIFDLGLDSKYFLDDKKIIDHIKMIERDFDLILILEYFQESLVLLRRRFCWTMKDVLSIPLNRNRHSFVYAYSFTDHDLHRNVSKADYMLYHHFLKIFWRHVFEYGPDFFEEVNFFRNVIKRVQLFCLVEKITDTSLGLFVPGSKWNSPFKVRISDCQLIKMPELNMVSLLRKRNTEQQRFNSNHP